jgi:hypothetical protein
LSGGFPDAVSREIGGPEQRILSAGQGIEAAPRQPSTEAQYAMRLRQFSRRLSRAGRRSKLMICRLFLTLVFLTLAICALAFPAYPQRPDHSGPEQDDPQPCMPPSTYVSHPGDPPFGVHVQTTIKYRNKEYILGVEYCEDGTFEFSASEPSAVSLQGTIYGTGRWWWEARKSCTEFDATAEGIEIPSAQCKEAGHWLGNHKVPVRSDRTSTR